MSVLIVSHNLFCHCLCVFALHRSPSSRSTTTRMHEHSEKETLLRGVIPQVAITSRKVPQPVQLGHLRAHRSVSGEPNRLREGPLRWSQHPRCPLLSGPLTAILTAPVQPALSQVCYCSNARLAHSMQFPWYGYLQNV